MGLFNEIKNGAIERFLEHSDFLAGNLDNFDVREYSNGFYRICYSVWRYMMKFNGATSAIAGLCYALGVTGASNELSNIFWFFADPLIKHYTIYTIMFNVYSQFVDPRNWIVSTNDYGIRDFINIFLRTLLSYAIFLSTYTFTKAAQTTSIVSSSDLVEDTMHENIINNIFTQFTTSKSVSSIGASALNDFFSNNKERITIIFKHMYYSRILFNGDNWMNPTTIKTLIDNTKDIVKDFQKNQNDAMKKLEKVVERYTKPIIDKYIETNEQLKNKTGITFDNLIAASMDLWKANYNIQEISSMTKDQYITKLTPKMMNITNDGISIFQGLIPDINEEISETTMSQIRLSLNQKYKLYHQTPLTLTDNTKSMMTSMFQLTPENAIFYEQLTFNLISLFYIIMIFFFKPKRYSYDFQLPTYKPGKWYNLSFYSNNLKTIYLRRKNSENESWGKRIEMEYDANRTYGGNYISVDELNFDIGKRVVDVFFNDMLVYSLQR